MARPMASMRWARFHPRPSGVWLTTPAATLTSLRCPPERGVPRVRARECASIAAARSTEPGGSRRGGGQQRCARVAVGAGQPAEEPLPGAAPASRRGRAMRGDGEDLRRARLAVGPRRPHQRSAGADHVVVDDHPPPSTCADTALISVSLPLRRRLNTKEADTPGGWRATPPTWPAGVGAGEHEVVAAEAPDERRGDRLALDVHRPQRARSTA